VVHQILRLKLKGPLYSHWIEALSVLLRNNKYDYLVHACVKWPRRYGSLTVLGLLCTGATHLWHYGTLLSTSCFPLKQRHSPT
jgi:hypothetical protein